jgi:signal transduction histidine kinase
VDAGAVLAVVALSAVVLLVALVVATAMVLRAVRGQAAGLPYPRVGHGADNSTAELAAVLNQADDVVTRFEHSVLRLADLNVSGFEHGVYRLADLNMSGFEHSVYRLEDLNIRGFEHSVRTLADLQPGASGGPPAEVSESRIVTELNHTLQTPLNTLRFAINNLEDLPDDVMLAERAERLAAMTRSLNLCFSALITFRGLVDRVASVPASQPSLHEAIRAVSAMYPTSPVTVDFDAVPNQVDGFSNHYLVIMLQPLVENAIEGCLPGGTVEVTFADEGDEVKFTVYNPVNHPVDREILFAPEATTKNGHQGLGVPIAQRLAELARGKLTAEITDTGVFMHVELPRR